VGDSLSTSTTAAAAAGGAAGAGQGLAQPRPAYTLREGVGMRRLLKFRVAAGVQLLLVQAASEVYAQQYMRLGVSPGLCLDQHGSTPVETAPSKRSKKMLDSLLDDLEDESSDESDQEEG
jgi:hypothetical protein